MFPVTMYCNYSSTEGRSIWNKKPNLCYFKFPVTVILCNKTVAKQTKLVKYLWYSDTWLKYPQLDTEADVYFFKYMFVSFKQDKEECHDRAATNTDV